MTETDSKDRYDWLRGHIDSAAENLAMYSAEKHVRSLQPTAVRDLRRSGGPRVADNLGTVSLVERDGVLHWVDGLGFSERGTGARRRRRGRRQGQIIKQLKFERLAQNSVGKALAGLDATLNAERGLREWSSTGRSARREPATEGRILLILHGTFSSGAAFFEHLAATDDGNRFFAAAKSGYDQVLSFEHPTLSVSPLLNAVDLARLFATTNATVDVICHSRGGLVARWWVEALLHNPDRIGKVILVGSPLAGTSLVAAPRLRAGLDLLTNVADVLGRGATLASAAVPLLTAVAGILKVFGSVTRVVSKTPVLDATVSLIPGLAAQSMTGDNPNIVRLREAVTNDVARRYFSVATEFETHQARLGFLALFSASAYPPGRCRCRPRLRRSERSRRRHIVDDGIVGRAANPAIAAHAGAAGNRRRPPHELLSQQRRAGLPSPCAGDHVNRSPATTHRTGRRPMRATILLRGAAACAVPLARRVRHRRGCRLGAGDGVSRYASRAASDCAQCSWRRGARSLRAAGPRRQFVRRFRGTETREPADTRHLRYGATGEAAVSRPGGGSRNARCTARCCRSVRRHTGGTRRR